MRYVLCAISLCLFVCRASLGNIPGLELDIPAALPFSHPPISVEINGPVPLEEELPYALKLSSIFDAQQFTCAGIDYYLVGFFDDAKTQEGLLADPHKRVVFSWDHEGSWLYNGLYGCVRLVDFHHYPVTNA
ncbi:MAG: hypothetical protein C0514_00090 [Candidatus Puniceispirillum sp.]|nr:hypothetical protein [Candidatus Puniceispirillum sp.]